MAHQHVAGNDMNKTCRFGALAEIVFLAVALRESLGIKIAYGCEHAGA